MNETRWLILAFAAVVLLWFVFGKKRKTGDREFTGNAVHPSPEKPVDAFASPSFDAETGEFTAELKQLLASGHKIEAIKRVREHTGLGLKEAKEYVDRL